METRITFEYTKNDARIISGIALCMMLMHHFWGFPSWIYEGNECRGIFNINGLPLHYIIAGGCQLCIPIFAFNTGYVLFKRSGDFTFSKNLKRIIRFLLSYWIVCFLFIAVGCLFGLKLPGLEEFLFNLIGIGCGKSGHISVPFAWYVNFYISFMLLAPLILRCIKETSVFKDILFIAVWILLMVISLSGSHFTDNEFIIFTATYLFTIGLTSIVAFMTAKYNLFIKLNFILRHKILIGLILIPIIIFLRFFISMFFLKYLGHSLGYFQDCLYTPLFVFFIVSMLRYLKDQSIILKFFHSVGVYSMNMWFLHGLFFVGIYEIQWLLYLPEYSVFVLIWGFLLTYPLAILMTKVQSHLLRCLKL